MVTIASILRDGEDPSMPALRGWLANLNGSVSAAAQGFRTFESVSALNAYSPGPGEAAYAFVATGDVFQAYRYAASVWTADPSYAAGVATALGPQLALTGDETAASLRAAAATTGASVGIPINGNPNNLRVTVPNATTLPFKMLIVTTNTGRVTLDPSSGPELQVTNGGGIAYEAGELPAGNVADVEYSPGGAWVVTGLMQADGSGSVQRTDPDLNGKPWGDVTISSGGVRTVSAIDKYIVVVGSSNAHPDYVGSVQLPSNVVVGALNEAYEGTGINWIPDNQARPGAPSAAIFGQLAASVPYGVGGQVPYVLTVFGMNECRTLFYNSEGGVLQELASLKASIFAMRKRGVEPVVNTIFPPDPRASDVALDPFWFASTATFPDGGSTRGMDFPVVKAAPIDPETQMEPRASQMLTGPRDWTGSGVLRQGYKRIQHWNEMVRALAAELNVMLLDFEWLAYRAAIETVPDLGAGLETFYRTGDPLHPRGALYDVAITPILRQWAAYIRSGRQDVRVFRGQDDGALGVVVANLADTLAGALTDLSYRPTLASAVADFDVGTFFTSRDVDGVSAYPGIKRQYQITSTSPFWADRGPWSAPADLGLGNVDNTSDADKPVSAAQAAAFDSTVQFPSAEGFDNSATIAAAAADTLAKGGGALILGARTYGINTPLGFSNVAVASFGAKFDGLYGLPGVVDVSQMVVTPFVFGKLMSKGGAGFGTANENTAYFSAHALPTGPSTGDYQKNTVYVNYYNEDPSIYSSDGGAEGGAIVTSARDGVGHDVQVEIATGNLRGRQFGRDTIVKIPAGADGAVAAHEYKIVNNSGTTQHHFSTATGKHGVNFFYDGSAGSNLLTSYWVDQGAENFGATIDHVWYASARVIGVNFFLLKQDPTPGALTYAQLRKDGRMGLGGAARDEARLYLAENGVNRLKMSNSGGAAGDQTLHTYLRPGVAAYSCGLDNASTFYRMTAGEDLSGPIAISAFGGSHLGLFVDPEPSVGGDNILLLGTAVTAPTGNPTNGILMWTDGTSLFIRTPAGAVRRVLTEAA